MWGGVNTVGLNLPKYTTNALRNTTAHLYIINVHVHNIVISVFKPCLLLCLMMVALTPYTMGLDNGLEGDSL